MVIGAGVPISRTPTISTDRRAPAVRVAGIRVTGASGVKAGAAVTGAARITTRACPAEVPHRCVTATAEMTDRGMTATATTPAEVAPTATAGVASTAASTMTTTASTTPAVTTSAAMLSDGGRRHGHCRYQHTRRQEEAPTLDAHDCLRNLSRGTIALGAL